MRAMLLLLLVAGCTAPGTYEWRHAEAEQDTPLQLQAAQDECQKLASKVVLIPRESCAPVDRSACPETVYGVGCQMASSSTLDSKCNKNAVKAAKKDRERYYTSCLEGMGWALVPSEN